MRMASSYMFYCTLFAILGLSVSYPTGAPEETCKIFTANHTGHLAQTGKSNYQLIVSPATVAPGGTVTVTLQGVGGEQFKGFFVQGQDQSTKNLVGKFQRQKDAQTRDCSGPGSSSAITHVDPDDKSGVTLKWTAPASFRGIVTFRAVVVKTYELFWNNIRSNQLTVV